MNVDISVIDYISYIIDSILDIRYYILDIRGRDKG